MLVLYPAKGKAVLTHADVESQVFGLSDGQNFQDNQLKRLANESVTLLQRIVLIASFQFIKPWY